MCRPGNRLFGDLAGQSGTAVAVHLDVESVSDDRETPRSSSCQPLDDFVACYVVAVPIFTEVPDENYRRVELPLAQTTLGRPFRLRLRVDTLRPDEDAKAATKSAPSWSWVLSPSVVVHFVRADGLVREYLTHQLGIKWYVGVDDLEFAPTAVLASEVDVSGQKMFRAVIFTSSDVYYVEPAADYPQVAHVYTAARLWYFYRYML